MPVVNFRDCYMFVAMCCRVLQGFAVCCSLFIVLQCVAACCSVLQCDFSSRVVIFLVYNCVAGHNSCVAVYCSVMQCDAV